MAIPPYMQQAINQSYQLHHEGSSSPIPTPNPMDINEQRAAQKVYSFALQGEHVENRLRIRIGGDGKIYTTSLLTFEQGRPESRSLESDHIWIDEHPISNLSPDRIAQSLDQVTSACRQDQIFLLSKV